MIHSFIHSFKEKVVIKTHRVEGVHRVKALQTYRTRRRTLVNAVFSGWMTFWKIILFGKGKGTADAVGADQCGWNNPVEIKKYRILVGGLKVLLE